jgi:hypothetical protein
MKQASIFATQTDADTAGTPLFSLPDTPPVEPAFQTLRTVVHNVLVANSGTVGSVTGLKTYQEIDDFLNWFAVRYAEQQAPLNATNHFDAIREGYAAYLMEQTHEQLANSYQIWADTWGGYIGRAPFPSIDEARTWVLDPAQRRYRQYHRMRIFNQLGREIEVIEAECNDI